MVNFEEGMVVSTPDGTGVISGEFREDISWPMPDGEDKIVEASSDNPVYIVALIEGGSRPYRADELDKDSFEGEKVTDDMIKEAASEVAEQSLHPVYERADDVESLESMHDAMESLVRVQNVATLSRHRGTSDMSYEELIDIPKVDDPEVGWSNWPDTWKESNQPSRLILLKAWSAMGGTWRGCFRDMTEEMTPRDARKFCSSMKDEVYGTEAWRGLGDGDS